METFDHLIIGAGIAGTVAAETIRQRDPAASIVLVGAEPHRLYSRVLLPHVLRGKASEDRAFMRSEGSYDEKRIVFRSGATVAKVDSAGRQVTLADGSVLGYEKSLLIATGGTPRKLDCPGAEQADALYFQTLDDTRRIAATAARTALVYGGGFIALEFHMSLAHMGVRTTAVMRGDGFFSRTLDQRGRALIADEFSKRGIVLRTGTEIRAVEMHGGLKRVFLTQGRELDCDAVAVGIGLEPYVGFLAGSGIATAAGVVTDDRLRSSAAGVYAAGDVAENPDPRTGERRLTGNWQNAMFQGKVAGANMAGGDESYDALTAYSITCFGLPIAVIGAAEYAGGERVTRETADGSLQFVLQAERVVGATCVGPFSERAAIVKLIADRVAITPSMRAALADARTPLASLLS